MGETTASSTTEHPIQKVDVIGDYDYVTVVGVWDPSFKESFLNNYGNSMNFINQGLRQLMLYPKQTPNLSIQRVYILFKGTYPDSVRSTVKSFVAQVHNAHFLEIDDIAELVAFVNARKTKKRLIQQIDIFAHGLPMKVEFGYDTNKLIAYRLDTAKGKELQPEMFEWSAKIYSYACRTAASEDVEYNISKDPVTAKSLAKILADGTDSEVYAYACRTLYDHTYGTAEQLKTGQKYADVAKKYDQELVQYSDDLDKYRERLKAYQKTHQVSIAQLPNEKPPRIPQQPGTDEQMRLGQGEYQREMMKGVNAGRPIDPRGAINPVRADKSPKGMDARYYQMLVFKPEAWTAK